VSSVPGEGSVFHIRLPAAPAQAPALALQKTEPGARPRGKGEHVLYIDDDEAIVFLMQRLLERQGYRASAFSDPREALDAVRADARQFDLVVTDYNMPGMNGLDVARALHAIRADLPVAVASGYITDELRAQAPAAGVRELIYKPDSVDEFCAAVARLADAQRNGNRGQQNRGQV
jgi:CheY-like chemotaxis protein